MKSLLFIVFILLGIGAGGLIFLSMSDVDLPETAVEIDVSNKIIDANM